MARSRKAKSKKAPTWKPWARVYEEDDFGDDECGLAWFVEYEVVQGKVNTMRLDAEALSDAKFEAASLTNIPEGEIGHD